MRDARRSGPYLGAEQGLPDRHRNVPRPAAAVRLDRLRPAVLRLIDRLAADPIRALKAIRAPGTDGQLIPIDIDATIVIAHSDKDQAAPTWKKTFGFHPVTVFADHGPGGSGEPLAIVLRPGNAGSNTAADHITATRLAAAQLPKQRRRQVLIRTDSGGGTHEFLSWLTRPGRRLSYSIGFVLTEEVQAAILALPQQAWTPAYDAEGQVRPGAWIAKLTGLVKLDGWPRGMRLIVRRERPHPGAQLRFTDIDGHRFTCFVTNTKRGQLADLELRHRRRARCEDRIRAAKDTGLRNLPLHDFAQNQIWVEIVALACELLTRMQMLALGGPARRYEPKRLRPHLFAVAARLVRGGRRLRLRIAAYWPWAGQLVTAVTRLQALPAPT
ncbi:IS1380 family transposase [Microbispora sp. KK1-11]|nr:IS1380 family transposase [Microbispora sp. KK1-11]